MNETKKHQKHPKLPRPTLGNFARNEVAILGAPCEIIENIMSQLNTQLSPHWSVVNVDADHKHKIHGFTQAQEMRFHFGRDLPFMSKLDQQIRSNHADLALINGNHYEATNQILILEKSKLASVERRVAQLTNILAVLIIDGGLEDYPFVNFPHEVKVFPFTPSSIIEIGKLIDSNLTGNIPPLEALILAGGKSTRMGSDKSQLQYGNESAIDRLIHLAKGLDLKVNISIAHQSNETLTSISDIQYIEDQFIDLGPFGAICSAFRKQPDTSFLVLACDLPLIDEKTISDLIDLRKPSKYATAVKGFEAEFPEPLIAIYEPKMYLRFLQFLSLGISCPRKVLINTPIETIQLTDNKSITNVNTREEYEQIIANHVAF